MEELPKTLCSNCEKQEKYPECDFEHIVFHEKSCKVVIECKGYQKDGGEK